MERTREERFSPGQAIELVPAAMLGCALALPARYLASLVFLASQHFPTSISATVVGRYVRWQLGWGLVDFQGAALVVLGFLGAVAWTRGSLRDAVRGFRRLLAGEGGHLVVALALACAVAALLGGLSYPLLFLLPPAGWVLPAADSYCALRHFAGRTLDRCGTHRAGRPLAAPGDPGRDRLREPREHFRSGGVDTSFPAIPNLSIAAGGKGKPVLRGSLPRFRSTFGPMFAGSPAGTLL